MSTSSDLIFKEFAPLFAGASESADASLSHVSAGDLAAGSSAEVADESRASGSAVIAKEFASLMPKVSSSDAGRVTADDLGGVVAGAGGSGNVHSAPSNSGEGSPQSQPSPGSSIASSVEGFAESLLGPIPSIISDIASIFGGGGSKAAPVFPKYELPATIDFQAAVNSTGGLDAANTNQYGDLRDLVASAAPLAGGPAAGTVAPSTSAPTAAPAGGVAGPTGHTFHQTFNMQAFDGDGMAAMSDEIAASVRRSLLTSNALSDVITNDLN